MATHGDDSIQPYNTTHLTPVTLGLSLVAGAGVTAMITAAAIGVIQGAQADSRALGVLFVTGLVALIAGIGGWIGVERPFAHFDDINQPKDTGHHAEHSDDSHALAVVEHEVQPHGNGH